MGDLGVRVQGSRDSGMGSGAGIGPGTGIWSPGEWDLGIQDPRIGDLGTGRGQEARSSIRSSNLGVWGGGPGAEVTWGGPWFDRVGPWVPCAY